VKTQWERREERRRQLLKDIDRQVQAGSLTIRQMTPAERARYPAREPGAKRWR
jgi:hypothetical protein